MPSNKVVINDSDELTFEIPDSWMPPLITYLKLAEEKITYCASLIKKIEGAKRELDAVVTSRASND